MIDAAKAQVAYSPAHHGHWLLGSNPAFYVLISIIIMSLLELTTQYINNKRNDALYCIV